MPPAARARPWAVLLGGVVILAVVAGVGRWLGHADVHSAAVGSAASRSVADGVRLVFVLALVVGLVCSLVVTASGGLGGTASPGPRTGSSFVRAAIVTIASLGSALVALLIMRWLFPPGHASTNGAAAGAGRAGSGTGAGHVYPQDWPVVLAVAIVALLAAAGAVIVVRSRRQVSARTSGRASTASADPTEAATFDPEAERDPRQAVIAAYHWVLAVLDAHGRGRHDSEAPFEHVERALGDPADLRAPARALAGAFEFARYSDHEVPSELRADAIVAARAVVAQVEHPAVGPDPT